ncbi:FAD/NAD(P)-binding domain-containing protein [Hypoxylon cercidicola]|nr:FAD/NAD(P)-binding domain-containing protein [Hypoxylon cercidicola]
MVRATVAIVGLGPAGLTALKCLKEEGFNCTAFERRDKIGGVWSFTSDTEFTTALDETVTNISKFVTGFSDFPIPKRINISSNYLTRTQAEEFFELYATHFDLHQYVRFHTTVRKVVRSGTVWDVHITDREGERVLQFEKVVVAHGCESVPSFPSMPNRHKFSGIVIHSQAFRNPAQFNDKRVLVVGNGNTACEASVSLSKHAAKVYQAYRHGRAMFSREDEDGVPLDIKFTWPDLRLKYFLDYKIPWLTWPIANRVTAANMIRNAARSEPSKPGESHASRLKRAEHRLREEWHLLPCRSLQYINPTVQDDFIPALRRGDVIPLFGFQDFISGTQILLTDGTKVEVDVVIFCTGYGMDFTIMPELEMDGACGFPLRSAQEVFRERADSADPSQNRNQREELHIPRLFQMMFPPKWASSVAILSWMAPQESRWNIFELASMALAQIWAAETAKSIGITEPPDNSYHSPALLPTEQEMNGQVDAYHAWFRRQWAKEHSIRQGYVQGHLFYRFLHGAAGTGMYDNLDHVFSGYGLRLWRQDRELWTWLAKGPLASFSWRLFDTNPDGISGCGRKTWQGAREAVRQAYETCEAYKKQAREKSEKRGH